MTRSNTRRRAAEQPAVEPEPEDVSEEAREQKLRQAFAGIMAELSREAEDRVSRKRMVELRWLEDLRQLHGEYDGSTKKKLKKAKKSAVYVNKTRTKTNSCEARLSDMMFPTDDRNWGCKPTPVPELAEAAKTAVRQAKEKTRAANRNIANGQRARLPERKEAYFAEGQKLADEAAKFAEEGRRLKAELDEAKKRSEAMQAEIEDQLVECQYAQQSRDVINDACRIGTGIMKGPIANEDRLRHAWRKAANDPGTYTLTTAEDARPAFKWVDPWNAFPTPDARTPKEIMSWFERHLTNEKQIRDLANDPSFFRPALARLIRAGARDALPTYLTELRQITDEQQSTDTNLFHIWEYRGPLTLEKLLTVCACIGEKGDDLRGAVMPEEGDEDDLVLKQIDVVIWFCQGELLKIALGQMDSAEPIYSVYNLEKDDSSIWGYGIPYMMRDSQRVLNGAWRMMMDNAGLSVGPQIVVNEDVLEPADGSWAIVGRKVWKSHGSEIVTKEAFQVHNITNNQNELAAIIELALRFIDDETNISVLAQGEQGTHTTQTSGGMALLMNAVNVVFRRMVRNFDDDFTIPNIRRIYHWNMQFSKKEHIKGDFEVDARGTSVLLVREVQSQNLMVLANLTGHPVLGILLKAAPILRKLAQSMMIPADEIIKTDDELERDAEAAAQAPEQIDPADATKLKIAAMENNGKMKLELLRRETALIELAQKSNMTLKELQGKLQLSQIQIDSKERMMAAEAAVEERGQRRSAAAIARQPKAPNKAGKKGGGSGGYFSQAA